MKKNYSVIVIGAGSIGMASGYFLAKNGVDTLLIDAFDPPHGNSSHHGETRLIRHAAAEGEQYVPLSLRSQELWHQLEEEMDKTLFIPTGTLLVGENNAPFIKNSIKSAEHHSLPLEKLDANEIHKRWPEFSISEEFNGYFESASGALLNEECISAYKKLASQYGAKIKVNTKIDNIDYLNNGVIVKTSTDTYYADKVIISAGAWTGKLLSSLELPLQPMRKTFGWFEANYTSFRYPKLPSFYFSFHGQKYYGFPNINGSGVKVARNDSESKVEPDLMKEDFNKYKSDEDDLRYFLEKFIPRAAGKLIKGKSCMITKTPDKNFIVDEHPKFPHVLIAGGFSGHGFKYSSVLGEILSQMIIEGKPSYDISHFSITRAPLKVK
ncbi:N-methyl-L-tryptophan oxidase [Natribacillus halophilus]|uniref:N-methyl-L-tryptophan oxidase n=1 Tax=Natribacillus halophilus TaxID=549003 RepID=A0A1G8N4Z5_9BACI|nr:N-methyl-L-tryptophan oxidase [Natribacillus halophilus]SDI75238.1 N-methyl-L-tryptophan oxidase [Natribacillus halophilus]